MAYGKSLSEVQETSPGDNHRESVPNRTVSKCKVLKQSHPWTLEQQWASVAGVRGQGRESEGWPARAWRDL